MHSGLSIARLALRHGVSAGSIRRHKSAGGWVRAVPVQPLRTGPNAGHLSGTGDGKARRAMVRRLLEALDRRLTLLETRMTADGELGEALQSAADAECDARALSGLTRLYAKLVELDDATRGEGKQDNNALKPEASDDADRLRRDLALRLQARDRLTARDPDSRLAQSIKIMELVAADHPAYAVGTDDPAGFFLEFGTVRRRADPWLVPALHGRLPSINQAVRKVIAAALKTSAKA